MLCVADGPRRLLFAAIYVADALTGMRATVTRRSDGAGRNIAGQGSRHHTGHRTKYRQPANGSRVKEPPIVCAYPLWKSATPDEGTISMDNGAAILLHPFGFPGDLPGTACQPEFTGVV